MTLVGVGDLLGGWSRDFSWVRRFQEFGIVSRPSAANQGCNAVAQYFVFYLDPSGSIVFG